MAFVLSKMIGPSRNVLLEMTPQSKTNLETIVLLLLRRMKSHQMMNTVMRRLQSEKMQNFWT